MSGNPERCVQRRIADFLKEPTKWIILLPMVALIAAIFILHIYGVIGPGNMAEVLLALVITFFSGVQGYSAYSQLTIARERNRIEDLRNELEKAYGPIYAILNKPEIGVNKEEKIWLYEEGKKYLDKTIASYPFMFPQGIYNLWLRKVQNLEPEVLIFADRRIHYEIPLEFRDKMNEEYHHRVQEYRRLLGKS